MNTHTFLRAAAACLVGSLLFSTVATPTVASEQLYTCGMHPQIIKREPGNCPICEMKLTPIQGGATRAANESASDGRVVIDSATRQRMNLRTELVAQGPVRRVIRAMGIVDYDESGITDVTTKYEGWIEKVYVNTTWSSVKAGDPLFEIYAPELYNAELNYLTAAKSETDGAGPLTKAALTRLQLLDIPADAIDALRRNGTAQRTFLFRAPTDGVVTEKMAVAGQMTRAGERLYRLVDLSTVWILTQVYEKDLPFVSVGQPVKVKTSYGSDRVFEGTIQLLLPALQEQTRTLTARIVLPNKAGYLRPGMYVDVNFASEITASAILVPDSAVLRSGEKNTVFVDLDGGAIEPREIVMGERSEGGFYEVKSGLSAGERVVVSGQFMLDSESQLREAIQKMMHPSDGGAPSKP